MRRTLHTKNPALLPPCPLDFATVSGMLLRRSGQGAVMLVWVWLQAGEFEPHRRSNRHLFLSSPRLQCGLGTFPTYAEEMVAERGHCGCGRVRGHSSPFRPPPPQRIRCNDVVPTQRLYDVVLFGYDLFFFVGAMIYYPKRNGIHSSPWVVPAFSTASGRAWS